MRTGELWWGRLVNSVRFLDDVKDALFDGKSVIMNFSDNIPYYDDMTEALEQKLSFITDTRSIEYIDVSSISQEAGEYLFNKYFVESERKKYWITQSYEQFMAENDNTILNHRILCISGINSANASKWIRTVTEYLEHRNSEERCMFVLFVQQTKTDGSKLISNIRYSDYVTDYDCLMLCLTLLSSEKYSSIQKQYISEIASNISNNTIEIAGLLAKAGITLAINPLGTTSRIMRENGIKIDNLADVVKTAVWKAQIKLVFPCLEDFRHDFIKKYGERVQKCLPITSSTGEYIDKVSDLEIGQLFFICNQNKMFESPQLSKLSKMRDARNLLAHGENISFDRLQQLKLI
jgi:hypothetical protein